MARTERGSCRLQQEHTGDCPACARGRIDWRRCSGPDDSPVLYAGACQTCGQWAGQCPVCGDRVQLDEGLVECPCETCFVLLTYSGGVPLVDIVTVDRGGEVRHTYAVPEE